MGLFNRRNSPPGAARLPGNSTQGNSRILSAPLRGWEEEVQPDLPRHPRVAIHGRPYEGIDISLNFSVQAAHYTDVHRRSTSELARIVASNGDWRLAHTDELVDEDLRLVAPSIEEAAAAMNKLGWFVGCRRVPGTLPGIAWTRMPSAASARADQIRVQLGLAFPA